MFESSGDSGEPCGTPSSTPITTPSGNTTLALSMPADQHEQPPVVDSLREPGEQPLMVDAIKELLQIDVDHPLVAVTDMLFGLGDRRVAAPTGPEPVADA